MSNGIHTEVADNLAGVIALEMNETNAFDAAGLETLNQILDENYKRAVKGEIKSLVLLSRKPDYFSGGMNLSALGKGVDLRSVLSVFYDNLQKLYTIPVPVISGMRGHALGYGCMLALMGDYRLLVESGARVGLPEVKLGLRIPRIVVMEYQKVMGYSTANKQVLEGTSMKSEEAHTSGFVDSLHSQDEIEAKAMSIANKFKKVSSGGLGTIRRASRISPEEYGRIVSADLEENLLSLSHPDAVEGLTAAQEGRRPVFTGPGIV